MMHLSPRNQKSLKMSTAFPIQIQPPVSQERDTAVERGRSVTRSPSNLASYPPSASPAPRIPFRSSRFAVVAVVSLAIFVDMVVYGVVMPTLPARVVDKLKMDPSYVGILLAFYAIGLIVVTPFISIYSDRFKNRKTPMLLGLGGLIATTLFFAYSQVFLGLALARFGQGVSAGISWTIGLSMISDMYPSTELGSVMGYVLSANTLGFLVGPPLGGLLSDYLGDEAPYLFCTGLAFIDLLGRLYIQPMDYKSGELVSSPSPTERSALLNPRTPSRSRDPSQIPSQLHHNPTAPSSSKSILNLISDVQIRVTCLAIIAGATVFSGIEPTLPVYLSKNFRLSASSIGLVWMAIVIPNMVSSIVWGNLSDQYGRKNITALGLVLFAASSLVLALPKSLWALILALIAFGFSAAIVLTPGLPEMADYCEEKGGGIYAQGYALYNIAYSVGMMIGPLMGGYLFQELGFGWQMFAFSGLLILIAPVVFLYHLRRTRLINSAID